MAATNYTPIQLYFSTTASAVPLAANLAQGELAINITDGKLYYEDNAGVVQVIATKGAGTIGGSTTQIQYNNAGALAGNAAMTFNSGTSTTTLTTLNLTNALGATYGGTAQSSYTQGDILYSSATNTLSKLGIGTVNYILTSTGSVPQWVAPTSVTVQTANNLAGGLAGSVPYQSAVDTTTFLAIGAANRVMTSTGSAPQWVTALTGLTGVSSSSITNTSLTSGRVVLSTTAGLQADSANLTFNGTTLSATGFSTTGLSTLVQTVTIGNSNFNGSAVFAAATPAKLYIGTGTVTDTTSAIGATNAVGAISSLAITPIAATNTSVTYTNAATLYIAGAPSAGTNVTLTNPYSLYVAAGTSYFGGGLTFAGALNVTDTTDATSTTTGSIKTAGGVGIAKSLWVGTTIAAGGAIKSTGANLVNEASAIKISQEGVSLSTITAYGTNSSTQGSLSIALKSSDGSVQSTVGTFTSAGLRILTSTSRANITTDADLVSQNGLGILATSTTYGQGSQYIRFFNSSAAYAGSISQTAATGIGLYSASDLIFGANSAEQMRLSGSLLYTAAAINVAIGTTSVTAGTKFNVTGNNVTFTPNTAGYDTHTFSTAAADVGTYAIKSGTTNKVYLYAGGTSYFNGGDLAIGSTSVLSGQAGRTDLTVNGSSTAIVSMGIGGVRQGYLYAPSGGIILASETGGLNLQTSGADPVIFTTTGTERGRFSGSGYFGINTTSSTLSQFLTINGSGGTLAGTAAISLWDGNSGGSRRWAIANGASAAGISQIGVLTFSAGTGSFTADPLSNGFEIMRLTGSPSLNVGQTATTGTVGAGLTDATTTFANLGYGMLGLTNKSNTANNYTWMTFNESNYNYVGAIGTQNIAHNPASGAVYGDLLFATKTNGLGGFPTEKGRFTSGGSFLINALVPETYWNSGGIMTSKLQVKGVANLGPASTGLVSSSDTSGGSLLRQTTWYGPTSSITIPYQDIGGIDNSGGMITVTASNKLSGAFGGVGTILVLWVKNSGNIMTIATVSSVVGGAITTISASVSGNDLIITSNSGSYFAWTSVSAG
jgi:hypothetical protein